MLNLRQRYLNISKHIFNYLKKRGFTKKGSKCFIENNNFNYVFTTSVPKNFLNSEVYYAFNVTFNIEVKDASLVDLYKFISGNNKANTFSPLWIEVSPPINCGMTSFLSPENPEYYDQEFIRQSISEIENKCMPLIKEILSIDDMIKLIEKEYVLEKSERKYFKHKNIYMDLEIFYAFKGLKQKTINILMDEFKNINSTVTHLVEKRQNKYLEYFKKNNIE